MANESSARAELNPYNAVHYPTFAKPQTHPDHLATLATLFGMEPPAPRRCRVLEIGCGSAGNLIPMALGLPESEFVGIDLASDPIEEGRRAVEALGLHNIALRAMNLMDVGDELGQFDYIIAFGVFTWIPAEAQRRMLEICRRHLTPQGVAYINYNAYPGFHLRAMAGDMLRHHIAGIADPSEAVQEAYRMADLLLGAVAGEEEYVACMRNELGKIKERDGRGLFHDELSAGTSAFYFHEFVTMAQQHGLQYLAEAEYFTMHGQLYGEKVTEALRPFAGDRIRKEQYLDFLRGRRFRQTLLCHAEAALDGEVRPETMRRLRFSSMARPDSEGRFRRALGAPVRPVHPLATAALLQVTEAWPRRLTFAELRSACGPEADADALASILLGCFSVGLIDAHMDAPPVAAEPRERPLASPLARLQLQEADLAVNLYHALVKVREERDRRLIGLLDGTRDRAALAREMEMPPDLVDECLRGIARLALLAA